MIPEIFGRLKNISGVAVKLTSTMQLNESTRTFTGVRSTNTPAAILLQIHSVGITSSARDRVGEGNNNNGARTNPKIHSYWITFFARLFIFSSVDPQVLKEDGVKYISWYVELEPGESAQLTTSTNYRPLFYIILFIIIVVVLYYLFKSPITVNKSFTRIAEKEGGISEIKVLLTIKNNGTKRIKDFEVIGDNAMSLREWVRFTVDIEYAPAGNNLVYCWMNDQPCMKATNIKPGGSNLQRAHWGL